MRRIDNAIRLKRFIIKEPGSLHLILQTENGQIIKVEVKNSSCSGLAGSIISPESLSIPKQHEIIPAAKLVWGENEASLGRLVVRNIRETINGTSLSFSCIDSRIPLSGSISSLFQNMGLDHQGAWGYELGMEKFSHSNFLENEIVNSDIFEKCRQYSIFQEGVRTTPLHQYFSERYDSKGVRINLKISLPNARKEFLSFASYDYLGMSIHPEVIEAAKKALDIYGYSPGGSLVVCGKTKLHAELEARLAQMVQKEDALLFTTGFPANVGTITALVGSTDLVVADILSHTSIHDGINSARGKARFFRHNNNKHLDALLKEHRRNFNGTLLITEGLFSMDGDIPNLKDFSKIAKEYEARTFVDEAHSFGIIGSTGLGASERFGVLKDVDLYMSSLSKTCGAAGGFIAGKRDVIEWLRKFARSQVFSVALAPSAAGAALKALEIISTDNSFLLKLRRNIAYFLEGLRNIGYEPISDIESPIIPVIIGDELVLNKMNLLLLEQGIFVPPIGYPAVPKGSERFRFSLSALHSKSDIDLALLTLKMAAQAAGFSFRKIDQKHSGSV